MLIVESTDGFTMSSQSSQLALLQTLRQTFLALH
jgi:hypothetical protein